MGLQCSTSRLIVVTFPTLRRAVRTGSAPEHDHVGTLPHRWVRHQGLMDLTRPIVPSGWSMAAMVTHLTFDDEIFWGCAILGGDERRWVLQREATDCHTWSQNGGACGSGFTHAGVG